MRKLSKSKTHRVLFSAAAILTSLSAVRTYADSPDTRPDASAWHQAECVFDRGHNMLYIEWQQGAGADLQRQSFQLEKHVAAFRIRPKQFAMSRASVADFVMTELSDGTGQYSLEVVSTSGDRLRLASVDEVCVNTIRTFLLLFPTPAP